MRTTLAILALLVAAPAQAETIVWDYVTTYDWGPSEAVPLDHHPFDLTWTFTRDGDDPFVFEFVDVSYVQQTHQEAMLGGPAVGTITEQNAAAVGFDWEAFSTAFNAPDGLWTETTTTVASTMTSPLGEISATSLALDAGAKGGRNRVGAVMTHVEITFRLFECSNPSCDGIRGQSRFRVFSSGPLQPIVPEPTTALLLLGAVSLLSYRHRHSSSTGGRGTPHCRNICRAIISCSASSGMSS